MRKIFMNVKKMNKMEYVDTELFSKLEGVEIIDENYPFIIYMRGFCS
jgi:hypothetical protein